MSISLSKGLFEDLPSLIEVSLFFPPPLPFICCLPHTCVAFLGYFSRWAAFRKLLSQFLQTSNDTAPPKKQILSLGAGFDTTYFQLLVRLFSSRFCSSDKLTKFLFISTSRLYSFSQYSRMKGKGPICMWSWILRRYSSG